MKRKYAGKTSLDSVFLTGYIVVSVMVAGCHESSRQPAAQQPVDSLSEQSTQQQYLLKSTVNCPPS
ncbi:hypothetical protein HHL17_20435 [Chitinophaga sp. G-6-1-13]|uniref:Uncharacterized protein n=1 Tax=Chitinophaga fulva TaxID=2728842 RepID=A0A848GSG9_9BACT|nr:hypothetical protein [Chitinophaga fulva]NML39580.1 hypothetical protein [Chitinophaga fulva]